MHSRIRLLAALVALSTLAVSCAYRYETRDFDLSIPDTAQSSFIYDAKGRQITFLRTPENRVYKRIDEIPQVLKDAVIAIEDERFYLHNGYDLKGLIRSARSNVSAGGINQGASTITQQYVGGVFLDRSERTAKRKLQEIALARQFENKYTKDFILEQYLNWIFLGNGANGVQAASKTYFNKDVSELTLPEAALIAGLIQRPSELNPFRNPDGAKKRRNLVLERMLVNEFITQEQYDEAVTSPVVLQPYVPITEERYEAGHFVEEVKAWFLNNPAFGETERDREKLLFEGGLKIYTTIDLDLQRQAEAARDAVLPDIPDLEAAIVVMDPTNGNVLAMVGGKDFFGDMPHAKVNLASGSGRQTGSSIKPIGLAAALEAGWSPTKTYPAPSSITIPLGEGQPPWRVSGGGGGGNVTLIDATRRSYNTVYAQLIRDLGVQPLIEMAARLGITHPIDPYPSSILGSSNVTMLDMATAFSVFAARGLRHDPVFVTRIVKADGTTLYEHSYTQTRVLSTEIADTLSWILEGTITSGTGRSANFGRPAAGKTGSAQNNWDATFIGYTPQRTAAVWVGFPAENRPMTPPNTPITVYGGTYPARIWKGVMEAAHAELPPVPFPEPPRLTTTTTPSQSTILGEAMPVPAVEGMPVDQARATLEGAGFTVKTIDVESDEQGAGTVVTQTPAAGSSAPRGAQVTLEVAIPPTNAATVPDVVGLDAAAAQSQLVTSGFNVLRVMQPAPSGNVTKGQVWQQTPAAGSPRPADGVVQIYIQP
ncbi:MAG TPA: transglycosylase domain-containing protein [Acidimicrobiales bacterium]